MKKIFLIVVILILVLVVAVAVVGVVSLDGIVKKGVETVGAQVTKVTVGLDTVHISLLKGNAEMKGFVIGNPDGYKTPQAISVGLAELGINPGSIMSDKIVIRTLHVESPEITFEGGLGGNNLSKILDNIKGAAKTGGSPAAKPDAEAKPDTKPAKKIEVDDFLISGAKVSGTLTLPTGKEVKLKTLTLPDIHLTDLGKGSDGLTPAELARNMFSAVTSATIKAVTASAANHVMRGKRLLIPGQAGAKFPNGINNVLGQ
jgi:hypothetical protein